MPLTDFDPPTSKLCQISSAKTKPQRQSIMRFTMFALLHCVLFAASASAGTILVRQSNAPPNCSSPCLTPGTSNIPLGGCGVTDIGCQCRSSTYVQAVINCFATYCSSHDDVLTAIQFSTAYCAIEGVNTPAPGITTPASQLPSSSAAATGATPAPSGTGAAAATTSTTSHSGALGQGVTEPKMMLAALLLAAVGLAAGL